MSFKLLKTHLKATLYRVENSH